MKIIAIQLQHPFIGIHANIATGLTVQDSTFHDEDTPIYANVAGADASNITLSRNNFWNYNWAFGNGTYGTVVNSNLVINDNHFGSMSSGDEVANHHHHDSIILYADSNCSARKPTYQPVVDSLPGRRTTGA